MLGHFKPIFHWKLGSRWLLNTNEINTKNMKCTWPMPEFCVGSQRNLYSTGLRLGFASGKTQLLGFASGKTQTNYAKHVGIFASGDVKVPNASSFALQWNIGFKLSVKHFKR